MDFSLILYGEKNFYRTAITSKHILTEYVRHDTYFLSFLSLTDKKVVHLQRIDK